MLHEITDDNFQAEVVESDIPCVIGFTAGWCTLCPQMLQYMDEVSGEFEGKVKFCSVNTDKQQKLRINFAVAALPFVVWIDQGMKTPLFDELAPKERLQERIQYMLDGGKSPTTVPLKPLR